MTKDEYLQLVARARERGYSRVVLFKTFDRVIKAHRILGAFSRSLFLLNSLYLGAIGFTEIAYKFGKPFIFYFAAGISTIMNLGCLYVYLDMNNSYIERIEYDMDREVFLVFKKQSRFRS